MSNQDNGDRQVAWRMNLARFNQEVADLETVVDDQVKICRRMQIALRNETIGDGTDSVANKGLAISKESILKMKELTNAITAAVAAYTSLQKTAKERAAKMTPEEMRAGLQRAILVMPSDTRRDFLHALVDDHNKRRRYAIEEGLEEVLHMQSGDHNRVEIL